MKDIDVFLCYRRPGAQTAKLFKRYLTSINFPGSIWYSDDEPCGNYKSDIPDLLESAKCAIIFVDEHFTRGFLDSDDGFECITALEMTAIERKIQKDNHFGILVVLLNRTSGFSLEESKTLSVLFSRNNVLTEQSVQHFTQSNSVHFNTATDDETSLFKRLEEAMLPDRFYKEKIQNGNFHFGVIPTSVDLIVCDFISGIKADHFVFEYDAKPIQLHRRIDHMNANIESEYQNNQMISLTSLDVKLSDNVEEKVVYIRYVQIDYRLFYKTLQLWDSPNLNLHRIITLYKSETEIYPIPNAMGLALMVVTSDKKLIFTKRSKKRKIRPDEYDCSIVEGLKPEVISANDQYDVQFEDYILRESTRAYREEICNSNEQLEIKLSGLVLDKAYGQWNIIGTIFTEATSEDIERSHARRDDTYEKHELHFIPFQKDGVNNISILREKLTPFIKEKMWGMALVTLYSALRNLSFSDNEIKQLSEAVSLQTPMSN